MKRLRTVSAPWSRPATDSGPARLRMVAVAMVLVAFSAVPAAAQDLKPEQFADLTLKVLGYDQNLRSRVAGSIQIGIVSSASNADQAQALVRAFSARRGRQVEGLFIETQVIDLEVPGEVESAFGQGRLTCLVVFGDAGPHLESLSALTRRNGVLSVGSRKEHLSHLSLGLVSERSRVKTYRSDAALRAERIQLEATFLNVARPL